MAIVLLHIVVGFGYFIWKLEFQGKKKKEINENENTKL
jgi:hypothetical protein